MTTAGQIYQDIAALEPVKRILEEADKALNDRGRTIATSDIPEVLGGIAGDAIRVGVVLTLVYTSGVAGVSAAGGDRTQATLRQAGGNVCRWHRTDSSLCRCQLTNSLHVCFCRSYPNRARNG